MPPRKANQGKKKVQRGGEKQKGKKVGSEKVERRGCEENANEIWEKKGGLGVNHYYCGKGEDLRLPPSPGRQKTVSLPCVFRGKGQRPNTVERLRDMNRPAKWYLEGKRCRQPAQR